MANTIRSGQYEGIRSQEGLDMCVSGSQPLRLRTLTSIRIADSEPIAIRVGVEASQKTWHVPKRLLTTNSTFFAAALDGGFAEQNSKTVTLPEVLSEDFEKWVHWLYLGGLHTWWDDKLSLPEPKGLVRLWNLGDMLGCPMFRDAALAILVRHMSVHDKNYHGPVRSMSDYSTKKPGIYPELLAFIWDACAPRSKLRQFAVDQCVIDVRMGRFGAMTRGDIIQFAEENEDFAKAHAAASITNGHRERQDLLNDCGEDSSIPKLSGAAITLSKERDLLSNIDIDT